MNIISALSYPLMHAELPAPPVPAPCPPSCTAWLQAPPALLGAIPVWLIPTEQHRAPNHEQPPHLWQRPLLRLPDPGTRGQVSSPLWGGFEVRVKGFSQQEGMGSWALGHKGPCNTMGLSKQSEGDARAAGAAKDPQSQEEVGVPQAGLCRRVPHPG